MHSRTTANIDVYSSITIKSHAHHAVAEKECYQKTFCILRMPIKSRYLVEMLLSRPDPIIHAFNSSLIVKV